MRKSSATGDNPPRWDLTRIYPGIDSPELADDKEMVSHLVRAFYRAHEGKVAFFSGEKLAQAVEKYEKICQILDKIKGYIYLLEKDDKNNFTRTASCKKWAAAMENEISFFSREIGGMQEADLMTKLVVPGLARYAPWLARQRAGKDQLLPAEIERAVYSHRTRNMEAWYRVYLETLADIEREPDRQKKGALLKKASARVALVYNVLIKNMALDAALEVHEPVERAAHLENGLSPEVAEMMFTTVKASFVRLSHRFHAREAGQEESGTADANEDYSWDEARRLVLRSLRKFSSRFSRIAGRIFDEGRIDAEPRRGKETGAFSLPMGPGCLPFIQLTFTGKVEDVVTSLGHELGHGVHQVLAEKAQGMFLSDIPTVIAETASIFTEMLIFEELLKSTKDPEARKNLLEAHIDNMLSTGLFQLSFYDFERRVHTERKNGELSAERISDIWVETQVEYYGPSVALDDHDRYGWIMVSHFFDTPFYVHSYSFAQMTVNALFQEYKAAREQGPAAALDFANNFTRLLETGMTRNIREMFEPFGLDPGKAEFWEAGLSLIEQYLNDLEACDVKKPEARPKPSARKTFDPK